MPNVLRWYWWRMNGWGYAAGTLGGILLSLIALFLPAAPMYVIFPPIATASLAASIIGSLVTPPVNRDILVKFYRTIRPFGAWKPIREIAGLPAEELNKRSESLSLTVFNVLTGMAAITGFYLFPMYLVGHWHRNAFICLAVGVTATLILSVTWYRNLPLGDEK